MIRALPVPSNTCVQPHEFIDAVQRDRLASLFTLLERCAPGQRPHLLVLNLWGHIKKHEQRGYTADVRAGVQVRAALRGWQARCERNAQAAAD